MKIKNVLKKINKPFLFLLLGILVLTAETTVAQAGTKTYNGEKYEYDTAEGVKAVNANSSSCPHGGQSDKLGWAKGRDTYYAASLKRVYIFDKIIQIVIYLPI